MASAQACNLAAAGGSAPQPASPGNGLSKTAIEKKRAPVLSHDSGLPIKQGKGTKVFVTWPRRTLNLPLSHDQAGVERGGGTVPTPRNSYVSDT